MIDLKNLNTQKVITWLIIAIVGIIVVNQILKLIAKITAAKENAVMRADIQTTNLSYDLTQYTILADKLYQSIGYWNTDESAVYDVFKRLNNADDVKYLIKAFGTRQWTLLTGNLTMPEFITAGMSATEIEKINQGLSEKNINISF